MGARPLAETQEFFTARAAGWEERFPEDQPKFDAAVDALQLGSGDTVLDAGCGTGRAIPRMAAQARRVIAVDATIAMLDEAADHGRRTLAGLVAADVLRLPLPPRSVTAVLAAGLFNHVQPTEALFTELARVVEAGGRLAVFHPLGRVALAAKHGTDPATSVLARLPELVVAPWNLEALTDTDDQYLALLTRS